VVAVSGGKEAVRLVQEGFKPDVVVTDQNMPGMDGIQTLEALREIDPDLPVLVSSGQLDIEEWECFRKPGVGVISKPFGIRELHDKLATFRAE
jgi:CheY-like chemotaxis protein